MKNSVKYLINFLVIFLVLGLVLYFSLKDNYETIVNSILTMNILYFILGIILLCLYRVSSSLGHYLIIKANKQNVSYLKMLQINFIILFFHGITPFAGGGQPMEVYYLHKEKIPVTKATNITLQNFIVYQIALVLTGLLALLYNMAFKLFPSNHLIKKLVILGFLINFLVLVVTFMLSFGKKLNKFICDKGIDILAKIKIIKDKKQTKNKFTTYIESFHENALQLKNNKSIFLQTTLINMLGLIFLYSIPYVVAKGLGLDLSYFNVIVATAYVMIIGSFVPIPGGTGGIEYGFIFFFNFFIKGSIVNAMMLVWRFISYYLGIILGAISLFLYRKKEKN